MKILAPISSPEETKDLIKAGADQLYCGLLTTGWMEKYTNAISTNRRSYAQANLSSLKELKEIVGCASGYGVEVVIALNAFYAQEQYPFLISYVKKAVSLGINRLIVGDMGFLYLLRRRFPRLSIYVSVLSTIFNSGAANFLKSLGVSRVTLPQYFSLREIKQIILKNPDISFEVFIRNAGCRNVQGFCEFSHGLEEFTKKKPEIVYEASPCFWDNYKAGIENAPFKKGRSKIINNIESLYKQLNFPYVEICGACNLWDFKKWGVSTVKIAGRESSREVKLRDVKFIKNLILYLEEHSPRKREFNKYAQESFQETYGFFCQEALCYYFK